MPAPPHQPEKVFAYVDRLKNLPPATTIERGIHNEYTYSFTAPTAAHTADDSTIAGEGDPAPKFFGHPVSTRALPPLEAFDQPSMLRATFERDHPRPSTSGSSSGIGAPAAGSPSASLRRSGRGNRGGLRCDKITAQAMCEFLRGVGVPDGDCVTANDYAVRLAQALATQYDTNAVLSTAPVAVGARGAPASESVMRRLSQPLGERPMRRRGSEMPAAGGGDRALIEELEREVRSQGFEIERLERRLRMRVTTTDVRLVENRAADLRESVSAMRQEVGFIAEDTREAFAEFKREFEAIPCVREARANDPAARARAVADALAAGQDPSAASPAEGEDMTPAEKTLSAGAVLRATARLVEAASDAASHRCKLATQTDETIKAMATKIGNDLGSVAAALPPDTVSGVAAYSGSESASVERGLRAARWMLAIAARFEALEVERLQRDAVMARMEAQLQTLEMRTPAAASLPVAPSPKAAAGAKKAGGAPSAAASKTTTAKMPPAPKPVAGSAKAAAPAPTPKAASKTAAKPPQPAAAAPPSAASSPTPKQLETPAAKKTPSRVEPAPPEGAAANAAVDGAVASAPPADASVHNTAASPTPTSANQSPHSPSHVVAKGSEQAPSKASSAVLSTRHSTTASPRPARPPLGAAAAPAAATPDAQAMSLEALQPSPNAVIVEEAPSLEQQLAALVASDGALADMPLRDVMSWLAAGADPANIRAFCTKQAATAAHVIDADDAPAGVPEKPAQRNALARAAPGGKTGQKSTTAPGGAPPVPQHAQRKEPHAAPGQPAKQGPSAPSSANEGGTRPAANEGGAVPPRADSTTNALRAPGTTQRTAAPNEPRSTVRTAAEGVDYGDAALDTQLPAEHDDHERPMGEIPEGAGGELLSPERELAASPIAKTPGIETQKVLKFRVSANAATPPPQKTRMVEGAAEAARLERMRRALESGLKLQRFKQHSHLLFDDRCDVQMPEPAGEESGLVGLTPPRS